MSENKIPDFFEFVRSEFGVDYIPTMLDSFDYSDVAIKFAKMHVEKALEAAHKSSVICYEDNDGELADFEIINNSYPLENIK